MFLSVGFGTWELGSWLLLLLVGLWPEKGGSMTCLSVSGQLAWREEEWDFDIKMAKKEQTLIKVSS